MKDNNGNLEGQKRLLAESYSAPEVRQLAAQVSRHIRHALMILRSNTPTHTHSHTYTSLIHTHSPSHESHNIPPTTNVPTLNIHYPQALLTPPVENVNVRGMGPGSDSSLRSMPLGGESMLERRINQLQTSSSAPAINNNTNNIITNNDNNNNPSIIPPETPTPLKAADTTTGEPISSVLSPMQICEQNAGVLTNLLARMPPLPLLTTSQAQGATAEVPGPDQGPAQGQGLESGSFDWRIASLRRVSLFSGGCQAAMSSIAQVIKTPVISTPLSS